MVKQSKRSRKFVSSGGVKGRLQKGTITNKGKVKRKGSKRPKRDSGDGPPSKHDRGSYSEELQKKREDEDFASEKNLGDLDIESFFATVVDGGEDNESEAGSDASEDLQESSDEDESEKKGSEVDDSGSDSDSEEEDVEMAEKKMKAEMSKLQSNDPEFHQFLQENEQSLLEYGEEEEESEGENEDMVSTKENDVEAKEPLDGSVIRVTPSLLDKLERGVFQMHGIKVLKKLVNAFKSACHLADAEEESEGKRHGKKFHIENSTVFDRLMFMCLTQLHNEFHFHLLGRGATEKSPLGKKKVKGESSPKKESQQVSEDMDPSKPINPKLLEKSVRWTDVKPILFTFFKASMHILSEAKEPDLVVFVLKSLSNYVPFMTPFPKLAESLLKALTALWSAPIDSSEDYQVVRLHSFLRIRQLAVTQPYPFIEECLKKLYLAYAKRAKFANASSVTSVLPTLTFMGNCVVELYSLDYHSSYQHAFVYIRQLALHLRTAMQKKTAESVGAVYCWQYLHCLKLWVAVLAEACQASNNDESNGEEQLLRSLLFPLSQVILGTARLIPSSRYLPLRLHCVRLLQQLAAAAEIFLPTTSILLDSFDLREWSQPPKKVNKSNVQPMALTFRLRADNPLRTMEELEMCISEVFVLLNREIDLYQYSAGFPEFSVGISRRLRKFSKETRYPRWKAYARGCLDLCERFSKRAVQDRSKLVDVAPKDVKQLEVLRPIQTPSMNERFKKLLEKEKRLEAASRPVQKASKAKNVEEDEADTSSKKRKRKAKNKKNKKKPMLDSNAVGEDALKEEDQIEEGINWSDDDE